MAPLTVLVGRWPLDERSQALGDGACVQTCIGAAPLPSPGVAALRETDGLRRTIVVVVDRGTRRAPRQSVVYSRAFHDRPVLLDPCGRHALELRRYAQLLRYARCPSAGPSSNAPPARSARSTSFRLPLAA